MIIQLKNIYDFIIKKTYNTIFAKKILSHQVIHNIGFTGEPKKRILFSYTLDALFKPIDEISFSTNRQECLILLNTFISEGYIVDFIDCKNWNWFSSFEYDIVFGFGHPYRNAKVKPYGKRILYCTEQHPLFSYEEEKKRIDYLFLRHAIKWKIERSLTYYQNDDYLDVEKLVVLSDFSKEYLLEKNIITDPSKIFVINPTGIAPLNNFTPQKCKVNDDIIWLGSRGIVHKGLDILIDAFIKSDFECNLHICGVTLADIKKLKKIVNCDRVIFHGRVAINSDYFLNIIERSNFIISLSCSESCSTSILTGMRHGLIPIITSATSVNIGDNGFILNDYNVDSVTRKLNEINNINKNNVNLLNEMRDNNFKIANEYYSLHSFSRRTMDLMTFIAKK
ncbi:glycosyltransferase [Providencia sp. Me1]|uniref:glycosyltransferase n=1 Tax=Providencia sp. Me1 TaxID=3392634 RepID=UPI003D2AD6D8